MLETWSLLEDRWTPKVNDEQWIAGLREYITEKTNRDGVPHSPYMQGMAARFLRMLDASQSTLAESKAKVAQLTEDRDNDCDMASRATMPGTAQADDARGEG